MLEGLKSAARRLKREVLTMYIAARDPRTPWYARALAFVVVGYALSPFDLIPDVIPVLGLLDDLILVPLGVWVLLRLIPGHVLEDARARVPSLEAKPVSYVGAAFMVAAWVVTAWLVVRWVVGLVQK